jgi:hypothetical protein
MKYTVHQIRMSDSEDPDLYVADPIYKWQQTDAGKWVMQHSNPEPQWFRSLDFNAYGYLYTIRAELTPEEITFFELKYK